MLLHYLTSLDLNIYKPGIKFASIHGLIVTTAIVFLKDRNKLEFQKLLRGKFKLRSIIASSLRAIWVRLR